MRSGGLQCVWSPPSVPQHNRTTHGRRPHNRILCGRLVCTVVRSAFSITAYGLVTCFVDNQDNSRSKVKNWLPWQRPLVPVDPHLMYDSLGPSEPTTQTAFGSVQPFCRLTTVTDRPTNRPTDRPRYSVANNRLHLPT